MHIGDLSLAVAEEVAQTTVKNAGPALAQGGGVTAWFVGFPAGLNPDQPDFFIIPKGMKNTDRI